MTVGLVIVSHSAKLAAGVIELAQQMTQGKTPMAAAGGAANDILGTSADKILAAIQAVDNPDGVLVLLDLGSAILSTEMALELLNDEQRAHTLLSYAPLVEGAITAAIEASLGRTLSEVRQGAEKTAQVSQLRQLKPLSDSAEQANQVAAPADMATPQPPDTATQTAEAQLTLHNPAGLHARPASLFVQAAARFQARIQLIARTHQADATSIMAVLSLGVRQGDTIILQARGTDASAAIEALSQLVDANFYETAPESQEPTTSSTVNAVQTVREPDEPWHGLEGLKHMATAIVPGLYDPALPTRTEFVATEDAEDTVRRLSKQAGLLVGWSSGAAIVAAERVLSARPPARPSDAVVVVIAPDSGHRYLSEHRRMAGDTV